MSEAVDGALIGRNGSDAWSRLERVVRAMFSLTSRNPELIGLVREISRLGGPRRRPTGPQSRTAHGTGGAFRSLGNGQPTDRAARPPRYRHLGLRRRGCGFRGGRDSAEPRAAPQPATPPAKTPRTPRLSGLHARRPAEFVERNGNAGNYGNCRNSGYEPVSRGILGPGIDDAARNPRNVQWPNLPAALGMRVVHRGSRFIGVVVGFVADGIVLRGASSDERAFRFTPGGFMVDAKVVTLTRPVAPKPTKPAFTASGSVAAVTTPGAAKRAKVARASRLWVEGLHDAELVEKIWGDDLRDVGIVVERLDGLDVLPDAIAEFDPSADAKLGVLVDHLVPPQQRSADRRPVSKRPRRHRRAPVRRHLAGRSPACTRDRTLARDPPGRGLEDRDRRAGRAVPRRSRTPRVLAGTASTHPHYRRPGSHVRGCR